MTRFGSATRTFAVSAAALVFGVAWAAGAGAQEARSADRGSGAAEYFCEEVPTPAATPANPTGPTPTGSSASPIVPAPPPPTTTPTQAPPVPGPAPIPAAPQPLPVPTATLQQPATVPIELERPTDAVVHVAIDYPDAWLETRSVVDRGGWQRACAAPCDRPVRLDGLEVRVTASGMNASNAFRIDPGPGVARLRVSGGSQAARDVGLTLLIAGLPVTFGGMALFGLGSVNDNDTMRTSGIVALSVGAAAVLVSLPLLLVGATHVRNEKGKAIAGRSVAIF